MTWVILTWKKNVIFKIQIHVTNNMGLYGPVINANEFHKSKKNL